MFLQLPRGHGIESMGAGINQKAKACDWTHGDVIDFESAVVSALSTRELESAIRDVIHGGRSSQSVKADWSKTE